MSTLLILCSDKFNTGTKGSKFD